MKYSNLLWKLLPHYVFCHCENITVFTGLIWRLRRTAIICTNCCLRCAGYQMLACYETDSDNEKHLTCLILTIWVNQWILFMFMQICNTAFSVYCETGCYSVPIPFTVHLKFMDHWISWSVSSTVTLSYYVKTFAQSSIISEDWVLNFNFWDYLKREKDLMRDPGGARRLPLSIFGFTLRWHKTARTTVQVISFFMSLLRKLEQNSMFGCCTQGDWFTVHNYKCSPGRTLHLTCCLWAYKNMDFFDRKLPKTFQS